MSTPFPVGRTLALLAFAVILSTPVAAQRRGSASPESPGRTSAFDADVRQRVGEILDLLQTGGDYDGARERIDTLFDQVIAYVPATDIELHRDVAFARRMVHAFGVAGQGLPRIELMKFLLDHPGLGRTLMFLMHPEHDNPREVLRQLTLLYREHGAALAEYPELTAAICVVHDAPRRMQVNENFGVSPRVHHIFSYYVENRERLVYDIGELPAELLVYVVDVAAPIEEMTWALKKYAGHERVGSLFFDIEYDHLHFSQGKPKKVTEMGWNLPNILKHGGICADQAYFAVTVGKSIGVPAAYTVGQSAELGHAWVGFLERDRSDPRRRTPRVVWNFDSGRYEVYKNNRGVVIDPRTRKPQSDSTIALLGSIVNSTPLERQFAAAMNEAARRLAELRATPGSFRPAPLDEGARRLRAATLDDALALLEAGLRVCPTSADSWLTLERLAGEDDFTLAHKRAWAGVVEKLCGEEHPDFYLQIVSAMISSVDDVEQQNRMWEGAFGLFASRPDLAAAVRLAQGTMWLEHGEPGRAGAAFEDVVVRFTNDGPYAVTAADRVAKILRDAGNGRGLVRFLQDAWKRTQPPKDMAPEFTLQSNWYKLGSRYASVLEEAGQRRDLKRVRAELSRVTGGRAGG